MLNMFERTGSQLEKKQGRLDQLSSLASKFHEQKQSLLTKINSITDTVNKTKAGTPTLDGVKTYHAEIKNSEGQLQEQAPVFEEFRDLGRQLASMESGKSGQVQKSVGEVEAGWDKLQQLLESR